MFKQTFWWQCDNVEGFVIVITHSASLPTHLSKVTARQELEIPWIIRPDKRQYFISNLKLTKVSDEPNYKNY